MENWPVYETSALYAIKARNHPQIISSLSILVPRGYSSAEQSPRSTIQPDDLPDSLQKLDISTQEKRQLAADRYSRKGLFTSLLLLYDIIYRQSPRDFINRFTSLTQADATSQGRRRPTDGDVRPFIEADDPHMQYTWNVYQAISQVSSLCFDALCKPVVRLRVTGVKQDGRQSVYRTDPLQRIVLSWAKGRVRQDAWSILQKGYHPQLGMGADWCSRLLLFPSAASSDREEWDGDSATQDMHLWVQAQGGRLEKSKVLPS